MSTPAGTWGYLHKKLQDHGLEMGLGQGERGEQGGDVGLSHLKSPGNDIPISNFKSYLQII